MEVFMKNFYNILLISLLVWNICYAQTNYVGWHYTVSPEEGSEQISVITIPEVNYQSPSSFIPTNTEDFTTLFGTMVRWNFVEPTGIGTKCGVSGNGDYCAVGWYLNNARISLYGNTNSTPIWEYMLVNQSVTNFVSLNFDGDAIAAGADQHIYIFNNLNNVPFFDFLVTTLGGGPTAGPVALTKSGDFLVATAVYTDSSKVLGFNTSSTTPVWSVTLIPSATVGGGSIQGLKLSGNDSLMIINTYGDFWVINTFTGDIIFHGLINPTSSSGTQTNQGISYNGNIVATINYNGFVRVFQWNGNTYNLLWQDQEPPGTYYNWANSVSVSDDGGYVAVGTLIFISSSEYNGTVKLYKTSVGGTPAWTYNNCGDAVATVSFNSQANVLAATSWGALNNSTPDLYIFKTWEGNTPIFTLNTGGSFFDGAISNNGSTLLVSGKAVHARTFGNGGLAYNIYVDTSDTNIPVEFVSFSAEANTNLVGLKWTTATEINNNGFEIQRNAGEEFVTIGFVEGHGTTTEIHNYSFTDRHIEAGNYKYRLKQVDFDGTFKFSDVVEVDVPEPLTFEMEQNYPNPFNPSTVITYQLPQVGMVTLEIYNAFGEKVRMLVNNMQEAGNYEVEWDGKNNSGNQLSSGIYLYRISAGNYVKVMKMVLLR